MSLDLSSIQKAVSSLEEALSLVANDNYLDNLSDIERNVVRAGIIQHFEITYELCWKFMQRWLRINRSPEEAQPRTRKDLFRLAARVGLIEDPTAWFRYADARNHIAHSYDEREAQRIYDEIRGFSQDARGFVKELEKTND